MLTYEDMKQLEETMRGLKSTATLLLVLPHYY
jgi:hypothetical protein